MNILYIVYDYKPGYTAGGSHQRTAYIEKALSSLGSVYIFSPVFDRSQSRIERNGHLVYASIERRMGLLYVLNHYLLKMFHVLRFHPFGAQKAIEKAFPGVKFDAVVCRYTMMASYCKPWHIAPVYIDADDLPVEMYRTLKHSLFAPVRWLGSCIVKCWQRRQFNKAKAVFLANENGIKTVPDKKGYYLMNLPPLRTGGGLPNSERDSIMTVAAFSHRPNCEGVKRFLQEVWPELHKSFPNLQYRLVGSSIPTEFAGVEGVKVIGFVEDLAAEYARAYFSVVPIFSGSGTCIKSLEAPSFGRVALCSSFGARGIDVRMLGNGIITSLDSSDMLGKASKLLRDDSYRLDIERRAPRCLADVYKFENFQHAIRDVISPDVNKCDRVE